MAALLNGLHSLQCSDFLYLNDEIKSDLQWWLAFFANGVSLVPPSVYCAETIVNDACLFGAGGVFGNECFHITFPDHIIEDIQSDNETSVQVINSHHSHSPLLQQCLRILWLICATHDLDLQAEHLPGFLNPYADLLS